MKRTIIATKALLFLLLAISGMARAQDFLPVVKDNAEWNIMWKATSQWSWLRITESLRVEGDTLMDDLLYKKVVRMVSSEGPYWPGNTENFELYGLIREETSGKVYYRPIDQDTTYLLYDFGMNVNDIASMHWCQLPNQINEVLVRIDSITTQYIAGMDRRVYYVSSKDNMPGSAWSWLNTWIEGIGAAEGLLYSCHTTGGSGITLHKLLCYHENGDLLYQNPSYEECVVDSNDFLSVAGFFSEWNVLRKSSVQPPFVCVTESFKTENDTLVDDIPYLKVLRKLSSKTSSCYGSTDHYELYGLIREEVSGKVFYRPVDQGEEYLLYDFGLGVNDTAVMHFCQSPDPSDEVVIRVDSVKKQFIGKLNRKVLFISSRSNIPNAEWQWTNTWIQGIGSLEGLLYSCYPTAAPDKPHHELLCYFKDYTRMYKNSEYNDCIVDGYITSLAEEVAFPAFFDSRSQKLWVQDAPIIVTLYDLLGHEVFRKQIRINDSVDLSFLSGGVYIVLCRTEEGRCHSLKIIK